MPDAAEIETKFAVDSFEPVRAALVRMGAALLTCHFEENVVVDTADRALRRRGLLLRLRRDGAGRVTFKLPAANAAGSGIKVRREIETEVADVDALQTIFEHLGYTPSLRYEKVRETWRTADDTLVCLDRLPFGRYLELEGAAASIPSVAASLGLSMTKALPQTYHALFQAFLAAQGLPATDSFVFTDDARRTILAELSQK